MILLSPIIIDPALAVAGVATVIGLIVHTMATLFFWLEDRRLAKMTPEERAEAEENDRDMGNWL